MMQNKKGGMRNKKMREIGVGNALISEERETQNTEESSSIVKCLKKCKLSIIGE